MDCRGEPVYSNKSSVGLDGGVAEGWAGHGREPQLAFQDRQRRLRLGISAPFWENRIDSGPAGVAGSVVLGVQASKPKNAHTSIRCGPGRETGQGTGIFRAGSHRSDCDRLLTGGARGRPAGASTLSSVFAFSSVAGLWASQVPLQSPLGELGRRLRPDEPAHSRSAACFLPRVESDE